MTGAILERGGELAQIHELIDEANRGSGRVVLIEGPAGVGKTRLIGEACRAGEAAGMRVLRARGVALERTFAFGVVRQLFEGVLADASGDERRALLSGAASIGGALLGFASDEAPRPVADAMFAALHGLYWVCFNLAASRPLLIAIDDAHLADAPSLRFVSFLAARAAGRKPSSCCAKRNRTWGMRPPGSIRLARSLTWAPPCAAVTVARMPVSRFAKASSWRGCAEPQRRPACPADDLFERGGQPEPSRELDAVPTRVTQRADDRFRRDVQLQGHPGPAWTAHMRIQPELETSRITDPR